MTLSLPKPKRSLPRITRDTGLLVMGIALTANEAIFRSGDERPYLLMLYAGMMGLPVFLRSDEKKKDAANGLPQPLDVPPKPTTPVAPVLPPFEAPEGWVYKPGTGWIPEKKPPPRGRRT